MAQEDRSEDHQIREDTTSVMSSVLDWQTERQTSWQTLSSPQQNLMCSAHSTHTECSGEKHWLQRELFVYKKTPQGTDGTNQNQ